MHHSPKTNEPSSSLALACSLAISPVKGASRTLGMALGVVAALCAGACGSESGVGGGATPGAGGASSNPPETLVVKPGESTLLPPDTCTKNVGAFTIEGTLVVPDERDIEICATTIMVHGKGRLVIGTEAAPFKHRATITLVGTNRELDVMSMGTKFLGAMGGGVIEIHGSPPKSVWTKLAGPIAAGSTTLDVLDASGWKVGDEIVVASGVVDAFQAETRRIAALEGTRVTLDKPLVNARPGTLRTIDNRVVDTRTEVGVLTRNVVIRGDEASDALRFGGHVMVMGGGKSFIEGVELQRMGQFDHLGRYPFHWHLAGDVTGQYFKSSVVNRSFQRGVVVHGAQHATVTDNIVFDTVGHNFLVETPDTIDNTLDHNLALVPRIANFTQQTLATQNDNEPANFWIRAAKNTFTRNAAAGSVANGFWYDATSDGGTVFDGNVAHSSMGFATDAPDQKLKIDFNRESGLLVQTTGEVNNDESGDEGGKPNTFKNSTFFQNGVGIWPQDGAYLQFQGLVFADSAGPGVVAEGTYSTFKDCLWTGGTAPSVSVQYNGKVVLENPTFSRVGGAIFANDIFLPWMADFVIRGAKFLDMDKAAVAIPQEQSVLELKDDTFLPRGFYFEDHVSLRGPGAVPAPGMAGFYWSAQRVRFGVIATMVGGRFVSNDAAFVRRSDGVRYQDPGFRGFRAITNSALAYQLESIPAGTVDFFLDLSNEHQIAAPPAVDDASVEVAAPAARVPVKLERLAPAGGALTLAASLSAFRASPATTFYWDASTKLAYFRVTSKPLTFVP